MVNIVGDILECGDLSPLSFLALRQKYNSVLLSRQCDRTSTIQSGDKSPHSKGIQPFDMSSLHSQIASNYRHVLDRIEAACGRLGRQPSSVQLVAVTKYAEIDWVRTLLDLGHHVFAESRPQQLVERAGILPDNIEWHLIGHLQRNKVRPILPVVTLTHSCDSLRLLDRIEVMAAEMSLRPRVLLEVNVSGESVKDGFTAETLFADWPNITGYQHVQVQGLMTMAPFSENPESARPYFQKLCELRDSLASEAPDSIPLPELSMGMSGDFEVAIEEGATIIRIGRTLYEGLPQNR